MKSVLISIQPKWCDIMASGKKTVEVRKTKPKLDTPFKVYIYETKALYKPNGCKCLYEGKGKVIGEFVCDKIYDITPHFDTPTFPNQYICGWDYGKEFDCLSFEELTSYLNGKKGYGWHISDLVIYDKPRELSEFLKATKMFPTLIHDIAEEGNGSRYNEFYYPLKKPPQSWCYVESEDTE